MNSSSMNLYRGWISRRRLDRKLFLLALLTVSACVSLVSICTVLTQQLDSQGRFKRLLGFAVEDSRPNQTWCKRISIYHFHYQTLKVIMLKLFGPGLQEWGQPLDLRERKQASKVKARVIDMECWCQ